MKQREIKFRAWDSANEIMIPFIELIPPTEPGNPYTDRSTPENVRGLPSGFCISSLMQFTGLLDKNGKDIWEGDCLKFVGGTCEIVPYPPYDGHYKKGVRLFVQKLLSGFTLCPAIAIDDDLPNRVGKVDNYFLWNHAMSFEVIGNIYENPELLNLQENN